MGQLLTRLGVAGVLAVHLGSCGATGPTTPSPPSGGIALECPASLLVGERGVCTATYTGPTGQVSLISFASAWSATPDGVLAIDDRARLTGLAAGKATVRVAYEGKSATADIVVRAEDGLVLTIATIQASGRAGEPAVIDFFGYYSVVSADSGILEVVVRAADGTHISTTRRDVTRGGGAFLLQNGFQMPSGVGRVCGAASLQIAGRSIEPTGPVARPICFDEVRP